MVSWDVELKDVVAEQMYLLRKDASMMPTAWKHLATDVKRVVYRDADRIVTWIVLRERCLRDEIQREREVADYWQRQSKSKDAEIAAWQQRALVAEGIGLADREKSASAIEAVSTGHGLLGLTPPQEVPPAVEAPVGFSLIDDAVKAFRSLVSEPEGPARIGGLDAGFPQPVNA